MSRTDAAADPQAPLRAIVLRDDEDRLVVQATMEDLARFAPTPGLPVAVQPLARRDGRVGRVHHDGWVNYATTGPDVELPPMAVLDMRGGLLYDVMGQPVARVTEVEMQVARIDVTAYGDAANRYVQGPATTTVRAVLLPGVAVLS